MNREKGYCLASQQIRDLIINGMLVSLEDDLTIYTKDDPQGRYKKGWFRNAKLEKKVQASSFDLSLAGEVFVLDARGGMFRPQRGETVYRTLLEIPDLRRPKKDITEGLEVKENHSYLIPLQERISPQILDKIDFIRSSPKSSTGRLFPKTRLLADYNPSFDEIRNCPEEIMLWILSQPLPFSFIIHPEDTLNQLRFFRGDAKLSSQEILEESMKDALLYKKPESEDEEPEPIQISPRMIVDGGLEISLDLVAHQTSHIAGLRVRKNPDPIDLSRRDYVPEKFFEPVLVNKKKIDISGRGEHYLFASNEIISIPSHLSAELRRHSREGIEGRSHDAGFADNGFMGDIVFEISPDEETDVPLLHEMPVSRLDYYRTFGIPDKLYCVETGSNYQGQFGPRTSKHFLPFDFRRAAKDFAKLSKIVLVQEKGTLRAHRNLSEGFEPMNDKNAQALFRDVENGFFHSRYDCEDDELILQPVPYALFFDTNGAIFSYVRAKTIKDYGDKRLFGRHSIGVGGHTRKEDGPEYIKRSLEREVGEEVKITGNSLQPRFVGTLFATDEPVDRAHFGLIYAFHINGTVEPKEKSIALGEMVPINKMCVGYYENAETETWTAKLIPYLENIYYISKP